jgi:phosphatidate phosphatase PAH1
MAHFAKIGLNGKVIEIQSVVNEVLHDSNGVEQEKIGVDFLTKLTGWAIWKQTSYNANFRKNFAGIGYIYDEDKDAFIPPKPFNSWILNEDTCRWEAPVAKPTLTQEQIDNNNYYNWNETIQNWELVE